MVISQWKLILGYIFMCGLSGQWWYRNHNKTDDLNQILLWVVIKLRTNRPIAINEIYTSILSLEPYAMFNAPDHVVSLELSNKPSVTNYNTAGSANNICECLTTGPGAMWGYEYDAWLTHAPPFRITRYTPFFFSPTATAVSQWPKK